MTVQRSIRSLRAVESIAEPALYVTVGPGPIASQAWAQDSNVTDDQRDEGSSKQNQHQRAGSNGVWDLEIRKHDVDPNGCSDPKDPVRLQDNREASGVYSPQA